VARRVGGIGAGFRRPGFWWRAPWVYGTKAAAVLLPRAFSSSLTSATAAAAGAAASLRPGCCRCRRCCRRQARAQALVALAQVACWLACATGRGLEAGRALAAVGFDAGVEPTAFRHVPAVGRGSRGRVGSPRIEKARRRVALPIAARPPRCWSLQWLGACPGLCLMRTASQEVPFPPVRRQIILACVIQYAVDGPLPTAAVATLLCALVWQRPRAAATQVGWRG
jgi:hypothetical protein